MVDEKMIELQTANHSKMLLGRKLAQQDWVSASITRLKLTIRSWPHEQQLEAWRQLSLETEGCLSALREECPVYAGPDDGDYPSGNAEVDPPIPAPTTFVFPNDF